MFQVRVIADSIGPSGNRLTTIEYTAPRIILAEINTHRMFSRNAESSRARPVVSILNAVQDDPFVPVFWGSNKPGMQAGEELSPGEQIVARDIWLGARDAAMTFVKQLHGLGLHKQTANRLLEPFMWTTGIISSTEWGNFFNLRCEDGAQPEFQVLADMLMDAYYASTPTKKVAGEWHMPYVLPTENWTDIEIRKRISTARCARVSTLNHTRTKGYEEEVEFANSLARAGHWSPFEHVAMALKHDAPCGNFVGWKQFRKEFSAENRRHFNPDSRIKWVDRHGPV